MNKRSLIAFILVLVIVGISCAVGYFLGFKQGFNAGNMTAELAQLTIAHENMDRQIANADCIALKKTFNEFLALLEKYKDFEHNVILSRTTYYSDKMLTHVRLARIDRKSGNQIEAQNQMKLAIEACR